MQEVANKAQRPSDLCESIGDHERDGSLLVVASRSATLHQFVI
jgi:hypothetical protein